MVVVNFEKKNMGGNFLTSYELTQENTLFPLFLHLQSHL